MYVNNMASQAAMREVKWRKGPWLKQEDCRLIAYVTILGERRWDWIAKISGLKRNGKSCRLRWLNYLRPGLKHAPMSTEEEQTILQLHERWGNKIAQKLPGRTDNEIKNYWRSCLRKSAQVQKEHKHGVAKSEKQNILMQEGNVGNTVNDFDVAGLSSSTFTNSAYESHVLDWTVWLSIAEHHKNGIDFCFCCPSKWCSEDDGSILRDWSASMWENSRT